MQHAQRDPRSDACIYGIASGFKNGESGMRRAIVSRYGHMTGSQQHRAKAFNPHKG